MILVVDVTKGVQTQTAECLVIAETLLDNLIVVLNKVDLIPEAKREDKVKKMEANLGKVLAKTRFPNPPMIAMAACPGADPGTTEHIGMDMLLAAIEANTRMPQREYDQPFLFAVDHCFPIKGQGTVMTGTVLRGSVKVNDTIEFPGLRQEKKVKSMQMFKQPVQGARQGDRCGICVAGFDPKALERGLAAAPGTVPTINACIVAVEKIRYYKPTVQGKAKWPITVGHSTVLSRPTFFQVPPGVHTPGTAAAPFSWDNDYIYSEELCPNGREHNKGTQFALLEFDYPITVPIDSIAIGTRLDADINVNQCRLAFFGKMLEAVDMSDVEKLKQLKVYTPKAREGRVDRVHDNKTLLAKDLFKKETDLTKFVGMSIVDDLGNVGRIEGNFGKSGIFLLRMMEVRLCPLRLHCSGKCKCYFPDADFPTGKNAEGAPTKLGSDDSNKPISFLLTIRRLMKLQISFQKVPLSFFG